MKKIILLGLILFMLTGCNYQVFDVKYTFNYAYCDYEYLPKEIKINKWSDYDGEQIQIIDDSDNVLLISSYHCILTKEKIELKEEVNNE